MDWRDGSDQQVGFGFLFGLSGFGETIMEEGQGRMWMHENKSKGQKELDLLIHCISRLHVCSHPYSGVHTCTVFPEGHASNSQREGEKQLLINLCLWHLLQVFSRDNADLRIRR